MFLRFVKRHQNSWLCFMFFIVSNSNYCPLDWHFCSAASTSKIERIQEGALKFISNDFTSPL